MMGLRGAMLSPNAIKVLKRRYLRRDVKGTPTETPRDLFLRVARAAAAPDSTLPYRGNRDPEGTSREFFRLLSSLEFLPNSPALMNAGRDTPQLAACFVLPVEDSMEGIFDALKQTALIHKTGGGTGFSFSRLRPRNSPVSSTSGIASGPVSFMRVFNAATEAVRQGGRRRGANMGILRVDHPDILEFIRCKRNGSPISNFNISVALTEEFMRAVLEGRPYDLRNGPDCPAAGRLEAREVFAEIVESAWRCGDPGILFIDRINGANPTGHVAGIEATNPCGEQPLMPFESCVLGSINLGRMAGTGTGASNGSSATVDWERLDRVTRQAVHFLDNLIEASRYPLKEIERVTRANRRIGIGVMGWADLLLKLRIPYDSTSALNLADRLMGFIDRASKEESAALAEERGPFTNWPGSAWERRGGPPLRNATTTTVAPTGSISIIASASSGIEPLFGIAFTRRNILEGETLVEVHPLFERAALAGGFHSEALMRRVAAAGSIRGLEEIPEEIRRVFATAHDIEPAWHVRMQAVFQAHCDNGVSKTVNLPGGATADEVREIFVLAYLLGCKGVTVFRDGCRSSQVLHAGDEEAPAKEGTRPIPDSGPDRVDSPHDHGSTPEAPSRPSDGAPSSTHLPLTDPPSGRRSGTDRQGEPTSLPLPHRSLAD